jgi:hypothetical protein
MAARSSNPPCHFERWTQMSEDLVRYVLAANIFREAARRYYAFDLVPPFWAALIQQAQSGVITSIDRVKNELKKGNDDLAKWASGDFDSWFETTDQDDVVLCYGEVIRWAQSKGQFNEAAKAELAIADNADAWLVAFAKAKGHTVVTHEEFASDSKKKIPLPNLCKAFDIKYLKTFDMLRVLLVKFG